MIQRSAQGIVVVSISVVIVSVLVVIVSVLGVIVFEDLCNIKDIFPHPQGMLDW